MEKVLGKENALIKKLTGLIEPLSPPPYIQAATSEHTRRAYQQAIRHFQAWGGALPAHAKQVVSYLEHFAETLNPRTLSLRLTALRQWHQLQGFSDPTLHPIVKKTLSGIYRLHGQPRQSAPALLLEDLAQIVKSLEARHQLKDLRDSALLQVGFFGALRRSELVNLRYEHLTWVPEGIELLIPRSKTDPSGQGEICPLAYGNTDLCPVKALKTWHDASAIQAGPVFRAINQYGELSVSPLAQSSITPILQSATKRAGLKQAAHYSAHSLRHGFATSASRKGIFLKSIMRQGRWKDTKTVLNYIEEGQRFKNSTTNELLSNL